jgi:hypothetical protein
MNRVRQLTGQLLEDYLADPKSTDTRVRTACGISVKYYYTVSVWPNLGTVTIDEHRERKPELAKISKSDQT